MNKLRNLIIALLVTVVPASLSVHNTDTTVQAHGPEDYSCEDVTENVWPSNAGTCNINGSIPGGLLNGITRDQYPNGLCFPSFNNYTDSWAVDGNGNKVYITENEKQLLRSSDPLGSPLFVDERNFVKASVKDNDNDWSDFEDNVTVKPGDRIEVYMFMHNDGDPCFNEHKKGIVGGIMTTSFNTKASFLPQNLNVNHYTEGGIKKFELTDSTVFNGNIWSSNAFNKNGLKGGKQSNGITINPQGGEDLVLEYNPTQLELRYFDEDATGNGAHNFPLPSEMNFFDTNGIDLSTYNLGATNATQLKSANGDYYASEPYTALLHFYLDVKEKPEESNVCIDLEAKDPVLLTATQIPELQTPHSGPMYRLGIDLLQFENGIPAEAQLLWKSTDPNGKFWVPEYFGEFSPIGNAYTISASNFLSNNADFNRLYYTGNGPVTVEVIPPEISAPACRDTMTFVPPTPEEVVCQTIRVNHHEPILEDRLSYFEANGITTNGTNFNGKITYSVESGFGQFYLVNPGSTPNPSNYVTEFNASASIPTPTGGFCSGLEEPTVASGAGVAVAVNTGNGTGAGSFNLPNYSAILNLNYNVLNGNVTGIQDAIDSMEAYGTGTNPFIDPLFDPIPFSDPVDPFGVDDFGQNFTLNDFQVQLDDVNTAIPDYDSITVNPGQRVYFVGTKPGQDVIKVQTNCTDNYTCTRYFDITALPVQNVCAQLQIVSSPANLTVGGNATLSLVGLDTNGNVLPANTAVTWSTTAGGTFTSTNGTPTTFGQTPVTFSGSTGAGQIAVTMSQNDPFYSPQCQDAKPVSTTAVCTDINLTIRNTAGVVFPGDLKANEIYKATATGIYSQTTSNGQITYTVDNDYGFIVDFGNMGPTVQSTMEGYIRDHLSNRDAFINFVSLTGLGLPPTKTVADNETITFFLFADVPQSADGDTVLTATVSGSSVPACQEIRKIDVLPPTEVVCEDLSITEPDSPWRFNERDDQQEFEVELDANGDEENFYLAWEVTRGDGEWEDGQEVLNDVFVTPAGVTTNELQNFDEETEVRVWATLDRVTAERIAACQDELEIVTEEKEQPEIEKTVYVKGQPNDADDLINIGDRAIREYQFLTYAIKFDSKDQSGRVDIREEEFDNGEIEGTKGGTFDFEEMRINIQQGNDEYTVLKTNGYDNDRDDQNFDDDDRQYRNLDAYEDDYLCDDGEQGERRVCINADSFEDVVEDFQNGEAIRFENVTADTQIFIKVQVENNSVIDQDECKKLTDDDGCGETFVNRASYVMDDTDSDDEDDDNDNDHDEDLDRDFTGSDSAKVIVICPYILTRTGGDIFFTTEIDTGIDVSQCSEVRTTTGTTTTPEDEEPPENVNTGTEEEIPVTTLNRPSHDVCRYSNSDNENIEGYENVLKNFSSTICEVKAEVSESWTESYINEAINANITRLSRFDGNLDNISTITSMNSLPAANAESGVFVKTNGNLTINLGTNKLEATSTVPAAQTYIVKGHDLIINSDINYGATSYSVFDRDAIPSASFIVIDGDIIINNNVKHVDGILMAVDIENNGKGKITNGNANDATSTRLTINGSLIGDVFELFSTRRGIGTIIEEEGSVVIRYDERVLLNPPPGLNVLVNISQSIVPN